MIITERFESDTVVHDYGTATITDYTCGTVTAVTAMDAETQAGMTEHMRIAWDDANDAQAWIEGMLQADGCVRATGMTQGYELCYG